jgi:hypothetical protein
VGYLLGRPVYLNAVHMPIISISSHSSVKVNVPLRSCLHCLLLRLNSLFKAIALFGLQAIAPANCESGVSSLDSKYDEFE